MRLPAGPGAYRDRLLDAMASLLVDLHLAGVYWGDCSLANTLFRRSGDKIQAYLVDAETSEVHARLSNGQRAADLEVLVENVAFGLADLALMQGRRDELDDAVDAAHLVRRRYEALWTELTDEPMLRPADRHEIRARIRRLNDLGFAVDEIVLEPGADGDRLRRAGRGHEPPLPRPRAPAADRDHGARGPGAAAAQRPPRVRGLDRAPASVDPSPSRKPPSAGCARSTTRRSSECASVTGPNRDPVQTYCDILEHKWLLSERVGPRRRPRAGDPLVPRDRRAGAGRPVGSPGARRRRPSHSTRWTTRCCGRRARRRSRRRLAEEVTETSGRARSRGREAAIRRRRARARASRAMAAGGRSARARATAPTN